MNAVAQATLAVQAQVAGGFSPSRAEIIRARQEQRRILKAQMHAYNAAWNEAKKNGSLLPHIRDYVGGN